MEDSEFNDRAVSVGGCRTAVNARVTRVSRAFAPLAWSSAQKFPCWAAYRRSVTSLDRLRTQEPALLVWRGQYDGIAAFDDLIEFFKRQPNPDK